MQKVINHHSVLATRTELVLDADERCHRILHIDTRLVLTPGAANFSEMVVSDFINLVNDYRKKHSISKIVCHECD